MRKQWPCTYQGPAQDHTHTERGRGRAPWKCSFHGAPGCQDLWCSDHRFRHGSLWLAPHALPRVEGDRGWEGEGRVASSLLHPDTLTRVESVVSTSHSSPQSSYPEAGAALKLPPFFRFHKRYDSWRATWVFWWGQGGWWKGTGAEASLWSLYILEIFLSWESPA